MYLIIGLPCQPADSCHLRLTRYCTIFYSDKIFCFTGVGTEVPIHCCCFWTLAVVRSTIWQACSKRVRHPWPLWLPGKRLLAPSIGTISGHTPWTERLVVVANQELPELETCIEQWYFLCLSLILQNRLHRVWRSNLSEQDHFAQVVEVTKLQLNSFLWEPCIRCDHGCCCNLRCLNF